MLELSFGVADECDLAAVRNWLVEAHERVGHSFICNWDSAVDRHRTRRGLIHVARDVGGPIAFISSPVTLSSIMEVHLDRRGAGIGRALLAHVEGVAESEGEPIFLVEAISEDAEAFWRSVGYVDMSPMSRGSSGPHLVKVRARNLEMPAGDPCEITIDIRDNTSEWWSDSAPVLQRLTCRGALVEGQGRIHLERRVAVPEFLHASGPWIDLQVPGQGLYRRRMRWSLEDDIGINECAGGFYIDTIDIDTLAEAIAESVW